MPAAAMAEAYRYTFAAMASRHELQAWAPDRAQADAAVRAAIADVTLVAR